MTKDKNDVSEEDTRKNMLSNQYARNQEMEVLKQGLLEAFKN